MLLETAKEVVRILEEIERQREFKKQVTNHSLMSLDLCGNAWVKRPNLDYISVLQRQFSNSVLIKIDEEIVRLQQELADL